jgi:hypothetical protein
MGVLLEIFVDFSSVLFLTQPYFYHFEMSSAVLKLSVALGYEGKGIYTDFFLEAQVHG